MCIARRHFGMRVVRAHTRILRSAFAILSRDYANQCLIKSTYGPIIITEISLCHDTMPVETLGRAFWSRSAFVGAFWLVTLLANLSARARDRGAL